MNEVNWIDFRSQAEITADNRRRRAEILAQIDRKNAEARAQLKEVLRFLDANERNDNDKLTQIFAMQKALDDRIVSERGIDKTLDEWVIGITLAMESEIDEIRREVNWKWWKNPKPIDQALLKEEVIDMWHFLVSLSDKVGLTPDEVYDVYCRKNTENHARQNGTSTKSGYEVSG